MASLSMKLRRMNKLNKSVIILDSPSKTKTKSKSKIKSKYKYKYKKMLTNNCKIQNSHARKFEVAALPGCDNHVKKSVEVTKNSKKRPKARKKVKQRQNELGLIPSSSSSLSNSVITLSDSESEDDVRHKKKKKRSNNWKQNSETICIYPSRAQILQSLQRIRKHEIKLTGNAIEVHQKKKAEGIESKNTKGTEISSNSVDESLDDIIEVWSSFKDRQANTCVSSEVTKENNTQSEKENQQHEVTNSNQMQQDSEIQALSIPNQIQQNKQDQQNHQNKQTQQNHQNKQTQKTHQNKQEAKRICRHNDNQNIIDSFEDFTADVWLSNFQDENQSLSRYNTRNKERIFCPHHHLIPREMLPLRRWVHGSLREIIIDGCNVAMAYTQGKTFSEEGLKLVVDYFLRRGHTVRVFVPQHKRSLSHPLLEKLYSEGIVVFTPSRVIAGKRITSYDDRFILQYATLCRGIVISHDQFRDLYEERAEWRDTIENRLLAPTFVGDYVMFPEDPLGRNGPSLDEFLRHP